MHFNHIMVRTGLLTLRCFESQAVLDLIPDWVKYKLEEH